MVFSSDQACETPTNFWKTLCHTGTLSFKRKDHNYYWYLWPRSYTALECYNPFPYSEMNILSKVSLSAMFIPELNLPDQSFRTSRQQVTLLFRKIYLG